MSSAEHKVLNSRIEELARHFVDFDIPLDRAPNNRELDLIASFKLLTHAEFEFFIEDRVRSTIERSVEIWKTDRRVTKPLVGLLLRWYLKYANQNNVYEFTGECQNRI